MSSRQNENLNAKTSYFSENIFLFVFITENICWYFWRIKKTLLKLQKYRYFMILSLKCIFEVDIFLHLSELSLSNKTGIVILLYKNIDFFSPKKELTDYFLQSRTLISYFESIYSLLNHILLDNIWKILNQQHQIVLICFVYPIFWFLVSFGNEILRSLC